MLSNGTFYSPGRDATIVAPDFSPGYGAAFYRDPGRGQTILHKGFVRPLPGSGGRRYINPGLKSGARIVIPLPR